MYNGAAGRCYSIRPELNPPAHYDALVSVEKADLT